MVHESEHRAAGLREVLGVLGRDTEQLRSDLNRHETEIEAWRRWCLKLKISPAFTCNTWLIDACLILFIKSCCCLICWSFAHVLTGALQSGLPEAPAAYHWIPGRADVVPDISMFKAKTFGTVVQMMYHMYHEMGMSQLAVGFFETCDQLQRSWNTELLHVKDLVVEISQLSVVISTTNIWFHNISHDLT